MRAHCLLPELAIAGIGNQGVHCSHRLDPADRHSGGGQQAIDPGVTHTPHDPLAVGVGHHTSGAALPNQPQQLSGRITETHQQAAAPSPQVLVEGLQRGQQESNAGHTGFRMKQELTVQNEQRQHRAEAAGLQQRLVIAATKITAEPDDRAGQTRGGNDKPQRGAWEPPAANPHGAWAR